jgi:hypothetical protein
MLAVLYALGMLFIDLFKSRRRLEAENLFLRHQLGVALRRAPSRIRLNSCDRAMLVWMTRLRPSLLSLTQVVEPETIPSLAPRGLQGVLALEVTNEGRAAED